MTARVFSDTRCSLGEGALWHPVRGQLFWVDILGKRLFTRTEVGERYWDFEDYVSAAAWVDEDTLLLASSTGLWRFTLHTGTRQKICDLEANNPATRSNDGRADPWGGFWIGTMGIKVEPNAGAIYRWYRGELRKVVGFVTISNAICFSPDRNFVYYCDTKEGQIMRQSLAAEDGWPDGLPEVFIDASNEIFGCDGAVIDADGCLWNAQWGAARVAKYSPQGVLIETHAVPATQPSCPAFGGANLDQVFVTTAAQGLEDEADGRTYVLDPGCRGQAEHQVIL